jgi:hypothetical protein
MELNFIALFWVNLLCLLHCFGLNSSVYCIGFLLPLHYSNAIDTTNTPKFNPKTPKMAIRYYIALQR